MLKYLILPVSIITLLYGCNGRSAEPLFVLKDSPETGFSFQNNPDERIEFNILNDVNYYNGAGVGIGDFNNDGLEDIYFTSNPEGNKLYLNQGGLRFKDITKEAEVIGKADWSTGVSVVDINQRPG